MYIRPDIKWLSMPKSTITLLAALLLSFSSLAQSRDNISVGYGWGMIYGDNAGLYKFLKFKMKPAFSAAYTKQLSDRFDLRASIGGQVIESGEFRPLNSPILIEWGDNGQAYYFKGMSYQVDAIPLFIINPNQSGRAGEAVNLYVGLGLGYLFSERAQRVLRDGQIQDGVFVSGRVERSNQTSSMPYIPFRFGISSNLEYEWDFALEFQANMLTNSTIDGNEMQNKLFKPDLLANFQFMVKRYIGR